MSNKCVCCGDDIPEGRQVCTNCEEAANNGGRKNNRCASLNTKKERLIDKKVEVKYVRTDN